MTPIPELVARALRFAVGSAHGGTDTEAFSAEDRRLLVGVAAEIEASGELHAVKGDEGSAAG